MPRDLNAFYIADLSGFTRSLRDDLLGQGANPPDALAMIRGISRIA